MIFDQENMERQHALDQAFAAGEQRGYQLGRERSDEDLVDLMIELRVNQAREIAGHYREGVEVGALLTIIAVAVAACASLFLVWLS